MRPESDVSVTPGDRDWHQAIVRDRNGSQKHVARAPALENSAEAMVLFGLIVALAARSESKVQDA
jgi:hypothetical protein